MIKVILCISFAVGLKPSQANEQWSACSKSCGSGIQTRRSCGFFGGKFCSTMSRGCNNFPCVPGWGVWSKCSKTCGGGHRFRVALCPAGSVYKCPKSYGECNTVPCKAVHCPKDQTYRYGGFSSCCKPSKETCGVPKIFARRVFNGQPSKQGEWPWAVAIVKKKTHTTHCTGNLVHPKWVLSAAHCMVNPFKESELYTILGSRTIKKPDKGSQTIEIHKFHPHEKYQDLNPSHDIGLFELKKPAKININVKPVCFPSGERPEVDQHCVAAGWGIADAKGLFTNTPSDFLIHVGLKIFPMDACKTALAQFHETQFITDSKNLCVGHYQDGKDTCRGDSGGPVVCQRCQNCGWYLAGTTVYGDPNCGLVNKPAIYMNIRNFQYWIEQRVPIKSSGYFVC